MKDFKKRYYEQLEFWDKDYLKIPDEKERIELIIDTIPSDVQSVLDVGCGNGAFVNLLSSIPSRFDKVIGLDLSEKALEYVKTEKVNGSISDLPFKSESFDLVTCLEVLEHLSQEDFKKGIAELRRVSRKYIIITVPNKQDLDWSLVMCPECRCWFNPYFHVRSFNEDVMHGLLENFEAIRVKEIGPYIKYYTYNRLLLACYRAWKKPLMPPTAICPQCGFQRWREEAHNIRESNSNRLILDLLSLIKAFIKVVWPSKKKKRWLLALYEKSHK